MVVYQQYCHIKKLINIRWVSLLWNISCFEEKGQNTAYKNNINIFSGYHICFLPSSKFMPNQFFSFPLLALLSFLRNFTFVIIGFCYQDNISYPSWEPSLLSWLDFVTGTISWKGHVYTLLNPLVDIYHRNAWQILQL